MKDKSKRHITIRISNADKETLRYAAASKGMSLSAYVLSAAVERAADDLLGKERKLTLSQKGWNQVMDLLENPPKASQALATLMKA